MAEHVWWTVDFDAYDGFTVKRWTQKGNLRARVKVEFTHLSLEEMRQVLDEDSNDALRGL